MISEQMIRNFMDDCWKDIFSSVNEAAVYIDYAGMECLHWCTGDRAYVSLKDSGAVSVQHFNPYNINYRNIPNAKKAVFVSTCENIDFYRTTIRLIMCSNSFKECKMFCCLRNSDVKSFTNFPLEGEFSYSRLKEDILNWMSPNNYSHKEYSVEISFKPIFIAPISNNLFVTPPLTNFMPPLSTEKFKTITPDISNFVSLMCYMCKQLNVKTDIYSVGKFSNIVADYLEKAMSTSDYKTNSGTEGVSIILIDRTLDLCTATKNDTQSVLSKVLCTLPHLENHYNDVAIGTKALFPNVDVPYSLIPGCIATSETDLLDLLMYKQQRDVLIKMNEMLLNMIDLKETPRKRISTRITAHSLEKLVHKCGENFNTVLSDSKKLQIILAVIEALKSDKISQIEFLTSLEKLILQNIASSRDSSTILSQISTIIKTRESRGLDMENLLALLVYTYSLSGTQIKFSSEQLNHLKETLAFAISDDIMDILGTQITGNISDYDRTLLLMGMSATEGGEKPSVQLANNIISVLQMIAEQRMSLNDYSRFINQANTQEMAQCTGILEQVLCDLLGSRKNEFSDIRGRASSLSSTVSSLLLRKKTKPHPCDNSFIIIYIIGGVTLDENKKVKDIISMYKPNCHITLAGSRLLTPLDIVNTMLLPLISEQQ